MEFSAMDELIVKHIQAERDGDLDRAVSVYTEDVQHDFVGAPAPAVGRAAARGFYEALEVGLSTEEMTLIRTFHGNDFCVTEHEFEAVVKGPFPGVPDGAGRVRGRLLHLFEFRDDLISRENVWAGPFTAVE
ncbi:nuclear transport factor 2 family protein [Streptomyces sp. NBC_00233]|uniref:nuclear transport factor 2 family protein n=1 Tax=Streptomyces sp. NBC_00233 TaxID=2975686 RepID=UPI002253D22D|nr:nuclear transport factor 2 family protein [Streptomyces sp. NBC_00233]MCX5233517.1 nuclear transport factor 2 family protein [Streptomyces sp. NBC_00233]